MAIIWGESFDLYGTSGAALLLRGYSSLGSGLGPIRLTTSSPRTGTHCLISDEPYKSQIDKPLDVPLRIGGQGAGIRFSNVATNGGNANNNGMKFQFSTGGAILVSLNGTLGLDVYQGSTVRGSTANNLMALGTYFWIETKVTCNQSGANTGSVEVRVNGVPELIINGLDIVGDITVMSLGKNDSATASFSFARFDDWVIWDTTGTIHNDFIGERRCFTSFVDSDGALQQWNPTPAGPGYETIDEGTPNDADYIEAGTNGDISEFGKQPITIDTNDIAAVMIVARARKTDAGPSAFRIGINSNSTVENSARLLPNTTVKYFTSFFTLDPATGAPWKLDGLQSALVRLTRDD